MSGGQDWAAEMVRDDGCELTAATRPEQVIMLRDDCREMVAAIGTDVWSNRAAADLKQACQRTAAACDRWLVEQMRASSLEPQASSLKPETWQPIGPTLRGE